MNTLFTPTKSISKHNKEKEYFINLSIVCSSQKKKYVYILGKEKSKSRCRDVVVVHFLQKCSIKLILNSEETIFGTPTNNDTKLK